MNIFKKIILQIQRSNDPLSIALTDRLSNPQSFQTVHIGQSRPEYIPQNAYIRLAINSIEDLDHTLSAIKNNQYRDKLSYTDAELQEIFNHEKQHLRKAIDLGINIQGSVASLLFYNQELESKIDMSFTLNFNKDLKPFDDMEICLAPTEPSEADFSRFIQLLSRIDEGSVDSERLYDLLKLYSLKSKKEFITDIPEVVRRFQGLRLMKVSELENLQPPIIFVDGKSYAFKKIDADGYLLLEDDYGVHKINPMGKELCVYIKPKIFKYKD